MRVSVNSIEWPKENIFITFTFWFNQGQYEYGKKATLINDIFTLNINEEGFKGIRHGKLAGDTE
jgi:hypothetical protein